MSALYASTLTTFKNQGWHYREVPGMEVIESDFEAHHTKVPLHVQIYGEAHIASVVATASIQVPATHRLQTAELLMRTNKELNLGNFELDWDSGAVMFRISNIFPPHRYDERILASLVHSTIAEMDRLTPFLGEVCNTPKGELILLRVRDLMKREELLPPPPPEEA
ncbi:MAG: YbjN domain-containing protein [Prosthecobacter sp.]|nr:YbjN domain-containing protein [Prosthecobacter sp.]